MAPSKSHFRGRSTLKSGRPPTAHRSSATLSHKATSSTIRSFHQLSKALASAARKGDVELADELRRRIENLGGLDRYQKASIQGQATDRGGDSSIVLVQWLRDLDSARTGKQQHDLRLLEVGALSTTNACSRSGPFDTIERIDLQSQRPGILQQDFMERPLPATDDEKFDMISLSLVLNFVPSPVGRGDMLRRTCKFLRSGSHTSEGVMPALFLVLPAACTTNSRFLNDELLIRIMMSLGYVMQQRKQTSKLVYYLWILRQSHKSGATQKFAKREVNPGPGRNNFCVVLEDKESGNG